MMNYESYAFVTSFFKKMFIPYVIFIILTLMMVFSYLNSPVSFIDHLSSFYSSLGIFAKDNDNLFAIIQCFVTLLGAYFYFDYENDNSPEFIKTRIPEEKICWHKLFILLIFTVVFRSIYYYFMYVVYSPNLVIHFRYYWLSLLPHLIVIISYFLYKLISYKLSTQL